MNSNKQAPPTEYSSISLRYILPIVILLLWGIHLTDSYWRFIPEGILTENRLLAPLPEFDINHLDPLPQEYEKYYNDHFAWRSSMIKTFSWINYKLAKPSILPDKVVYGKEGWLFRTGDQLKLYQGSRKFTQNELEEITTKLEYRRKKVEELGGNYYLSFAPLKHEIYSEYLPDNVIKYENESAREQLVRHLKENTSITYIDLHAPIKHWKNEHNAQDTVLYYRTDHHWTNIAALIAMQEITKQLKFDFPEISILKLNDYDLKFHERDGLSLAQILGIEKELKDQWSSISPTKPYKAKRIDRSDITPPSTFGYPTEYAIDFRQKTHKDLPTIFINRESFANNLIEPLSEHFSKTFFLFDEWKHDFNEDLYLQEGGDIYLQMVWEGFILNLLKSEQDQSF